MLTPARFTGLSSGVSIREDAFHHPWCQRDIVTCSSKTTFLSCIALLSFLYIEKCEYSAKCLSLSLDYKLQEIMGVFSFIHCKFHAQCLGHDKFSVIIPCLNEWAWNNCTLSFRKVSFPLPPAQRWKIRFQRQQRTTHKPLSNCIQVYLVLGLPRGHQW